MILKDIEVTLRFLHLSKFYYRLMPMAEKLLYKCLHIFKMCDSYFQKGAAAKQKFRNYLAGVVTT